MLKLSETTKRVLFWTTSGLGTAAIVLVGTNAVLYSGNQALQLEIGQRQQIIDQGVQLGRISDILVRALSAAVARGDEGNIRELLTRSGITVMTKLPDAAQPEAKGN